MDDEESSHSSFTGSPSMNPAFANGGAFDINYLLNLANQPDFSSSSSESQSQPSRAQSPSDWMSGLPEHAVINPGWKFDPETLGNSVDPNSLLMQGGDYNFGPSIYPPAMQTFQFEQALPGREQIIQPPIHYAIPEIFEPTQQPAYRPQQVDRNPNFQQTQHVPQSRIPVSSLPQGRSGVGIMDADAIGRRARELAGVSYAVTPAQQAEALRLQQQQQTLSLPQLPHNYAGIQEQPHHALSHSLSPTPSFSASSGASPESMPIYDSTKSRTKTSHTTIERRYRTNLNARIVALRHAVPALRILERDKFPDEKADERGYVDGVKAARKASKGSILGKAAEYIG